MPKLSSEIKTLVSDSVKKNCNSNTAKPISAIAYYFEKAIVAKENIPIGLINLSIGGTPIETFISKDALKIKISNKSER